MPNWIIVNLCYIFLDYVVCLYLFFSFVVFFFPVKLSYAVDVWCCCSIRQQNL